MVKVAFVEPSGNKVTLEVTPGTTGMEAARSNDVQGILAECGGSPACGTCHVYVDETYLSRIAQATTQENDILSGTASERRHNSRLSCQIKLTEDLSGITFVIPAAQV